MENKVGRTIAERRKELGMTQEDLAKKLGYKSKSTINKIELGINDVSQSKLVQFAEALDTTPSYLMGWIERENRIHTSAHDVISEMLSKNVETTFDHILMDIIRDKNKMSDSSRMKAKLMLEISKLNDMQVEKVLTFIDMIK